MERDCGLRAPCTGKVPRKKRCASPLPQAAALPNSRAGVSQMCRWRLFGGAGPRGTEPASKSLSRAAAGLGMQEAGSVPVGKGGGEKTLRCGLSGVFSWVKTLRQGNPAKVFTDSVFGVPRKGLFLTRVPSAADPV